MSDAEALNHESPSNDSRIVLEMAQRVALEILSSKTGIEALRHIVEAARELTHARYAALGVARSGNVHGLQEFITVGINPVEEALIGPRPVGAGLLGLLLQRSESLRIDSIADHPESAGFPPNHPPMTTFLGVPIIAGGVTVGSIYLTDKIGGGSFTSEDEIALEELGAHAAVAIRNLQMLSRQRALVTGLIMAQEEERRAVAYDLHDGLTQYVMASHAHFEAYRSALTSSNAERAEREFDAGMRYLNEAVIESRRLVNGLRTLALDDLGLAGALEQIFAEDGRRAGWIDTKFVHNIAGVRFDPTLETSAYRIAQEALTNIRKHAKASQVQLTVLLDEPETKPRYLHLEVRDWGVGFDLDDHSNDNRVGLHSMHERLNNLNGEWTLISKPGDGTTVRADIPLPAGSELSGEQTV
jgi:signal transduction histidine kinase